MKREQRARRRKWTEQETARLLDARKRGKSYTRCATMLRRSYRSIAAKLRKLRATRGSPQRGKRRFELDWSLREERVVRRFYSTLGPSVLAERLNRTAAAVSRRAYDLRLLRPAPRWCYCDVITVLMSAVPANRVKLQSNRTATAIHLIRVRLRFMSRTGHLDAYLKNRPGAPAKRAKFDGHFPPGLRFGGYKLTEKGKAMRAREYVAREAERERQREARKKWQAKK